MKKKSLPTSLSPPNAPRCCRPKPSQHGSSPSNSTGPSTITLTHPSQTHPHTPRREKQRTHPQPQPQGHAGLHCPAHQPGKGRRLLPQHPHRHGQPQRARTGGHRKNRHLTQIFPLRSRRKRVASHHGAAQKHQLLRQTCADNRRLHLGPTRRQRRFKSTYPSKKRGIQHFPSPPQRICLRRAKRKKQQPFGKESAQK